MTAHASAVRAITAVFFQRFLRIGFWLLGTSFVIFFAITTLLAMQLSDWWWLLLIILIPVYVVLTVVGLVFWILSNRVLPRHLSKQERADISRFSGTLAGLIETARTPYPLVLFLIAKDIIRGKKSRFLEENVLSSKSIKTDYQAILRLFE